MARPENRSEARALSLTLPTETFNYLVIDKTSNSVQLQTNVAVNAEQKVVFDFVGRVASLARPIATNYDVPPERVAALRRAFDLTMKDPV